MIVELDSLWSDYRANCLVFFSGLIIILHDFGAHSVRTADSGR